MHNDSNFQILSRVDEGYIGVCACCNRFNFVYKNILAIFSEDELFNFLEWLHVHRYDRECRVPLHHGRNKVFASPHSNLFLTFNDDELEEVSTMAAQARLMLDTQRILFLRGMN